MTTPFGIPTFVKVGKKKTPKQLGAPGTVRPPTEVGQATLPGTTTCNQKNLSAGTNVVAWDLPTGQSGDGTLTVITHSTGSSADLTTPTGWTDLGDLVSGAGRMHALWKVYDGTEPTSTTYTITNSNNGDKTVQTTWLIKANGTDLSLNDPEAAFAAAAGPSSVDPPTITPSTGADTYFVFAVGFTGDKILTGFPTDYSILVDDCSASGFGTLYVGHQTIAIVTSEDPGVFSPAISSTGQWSSATIALLQSQGDPGVAAGDHTHLEADVTDLDHWTETDHDALDHTGLTGIVADHGALTGLADDDHTQYSKADGTRAFTGTVSGVTPTVDAHLATKAYVDGNAGRYEVLLVDNAGTLEPLTNDAGDDWLYVEV